MVRNIPIKYLFVFGTVCIIFSLLLNAFIQLPGVVTLQSFFLYYIPFFFGAVGGMFVLIGLLSLINKPVQKWYEEHKRNSTDKKAIENDAVKDEDIKESKEIRYNQKYLSSDSFRQGFYFTLGAITAAFVIGAFIFIIISFFAGSILNSLKSNLQPRTMYQQPY